MRKKKFIKKRKSGHKRFSKYYTVSRGGIQLCLAAFVLGVMSWSCTIRHKLLPAEIEINSIEVVTDSLSETDKFLMFNN